MNKRSIIDIEMKIVSNKTNEPMKKKIASSKRKKSINRHGAGTKNMAVGGSLLVLVLLFFAACGKSGKGGDGEAVAARFSADIEAAVSRAADTRWADGDAIGITCTIGTVEHRNVKHVIAAGSGNTFEVSDPVATIYFDDDAPVAFTAYYPHASTSGEAVTMITATTDASNQTGAAQPGIDFLHATATGSMASPGVQFTFTHRMSRVAFTIEAGEGLSSLAPVTGYSVGGLVLDGSFSPLSGTAMASGAVADLEIPLTVGTGVAEVTSTLILYPQTLVSALLTMILADPTSGGTQFFTATLAIPDGELKPGYSYTYPVTVSKTAVVVGQATIVGWTHEHGGDVDAK